MFQNLTLDLAQSSRLDDAQGAAVAEVQAGSPAAQVGLRCGDVITAVDSHVVGSAGDQCNTIGLKVMDNRIDLTVIHNSQRFKVAAWVH